MHSWHTGPFGLCHCSEACLRRGMVPLIFGNPSNRFAFVSKLRKRAIGHKELEEELNKKSQCAAVIGVRCRGTKAAASS